MHIALAPFKLKHGVAEETLLNTSEEFEHLFVQKQDGILRRILVRDSDGGYADIVFFEDEGDRARPGRRTTQRRLRGILLDHGRRGLIPRIRGPQDLRVMGSPTRSAATSSRCHRHRDRHERWGRHPVAASGASRRPWAGPLPHGAGRAAAVADRPYELAGLLAEAEREVLDPGRWGRDFRGISTRSFLYGVTVKRNGSHDQIYVITSRSPSPSRVDLDRCAHDRVAAPLFGELDKETSSKRLT